MVLVLFLGVVVVWIVVLFICDNGLMFVNGVDLCEYDVFVGMVYLIFGVILGMRISVGILM